MTDFFYVENRASDAALAALESFYSSVDAVVTNPTNPPIAAPHGPPIIAPEPAPPNAPPNMDMAAPDFSYPASFNEVPS